MDVLITGAAGNLGSELARHLLQTPHQLRLLIHRKPLPADLSTSDAIVFRADLGNPSTLVDTCRGADCIIHFAGVLFAPRPERFLHLTNVAYVDNLVDAAVAAGVKKFILVSFPQVEGETTPQQRATGARDGAPESVHARTRLAAEKHLFAACERSAMRPVVLRPNMIYSRGVLMIEAARWLMKRRLLAVWRRPTWTHLLALPDFFACVTSAIERETAAGVYNLGDDRPLTLQNFIDTLASHWGYAKPWRLPAWSFYAAAATVEAFATVFRTKSPLHRDFIRIGMVSAVSDTSRMKRELLAKLAYPTIQEGLSLL